MKLSDLKRLLRPLQTQIANVISRAVVKLVDDSKKWQELQVQLGPDEVREVERAQQYGFTSVPLPDAEAVIAFLGGKRDHGVVIAVDDRRYRLKGLQGGEVAIYTDQNDRIVLKRGGNVEVHASTKVLITSPLVETTAKLKVGGVLEVVGNATIAGTLGVTGTLTGSTINANEVSDGGKVLGTHTHSAGSFTTPSGGAVTGSSGSPE